MTATYTLLFHLLFFFYRLSRFCEATESHSRTHAPPSSLPNKSSSYGRYIRSINSSQQGQLISKQNVMSQLAAVQHKFFNSNMGALFFCHFPLQSTHTGPRAQNDLCNCKYLIIHSPQGFSGIIYNTGWGTLPDCLRCSLQVVKE